MRGPSFYVSPSDDNRKTLPLVCFLSNFDFKKFHRWNFFILGYVLTSKNYLSFIWRAFSCCSAIFKQYVNCSTSRIAINDVRSSAFSLIRKASNAS